MSEYGGCLVCGVVLGGPDRGEDLLCADCQSNYYMSQTGTTAKLIWVTDAGPRRVSEAELATAMEDWYGRLGDHPRTWIDEDAPGIFAALVAAQEKGETGS